MKAYTVAIGNFSFPLTKDQKKVLKMIEEMEGLIGLHPVYPHGTLLLFDSKNHAIEGRNILRFEKVDTGRNICEVEIDEKYAHAS